MAGRASQKTAGPGRVGSQMSGWAACLHVHRHGTGWAHAPSPGAIPATAVCNLAGGWGGGGAVHSRCPSPAPPPTAPHPPRDPASETMEGPGAGQQLRLSPHCPGESRQEQRSHRECRGVPPLLPRTRTPQSVRPGPWGDGMPWGTGERAGWWQVGARDQTAPPSPRARLPGNEAPALGEEGLKIVTFTTGQCGGPENCAQPAAASGDKHLVPAGPLAAPFPCQTRGTSPGLHGEQRLSAGEAALGGFQQAPSCSARELGPVSH